MIRFSQVTERLKPSEWRFLAEGARLKDRFLPMQGKVLSFDTWGVEGVKPCPVWVHLLLLCF